MPRSTTPPEVRAAAIADLQTGEQPAIVAERYGLDRELVKKWAQRLVPARVPRFDSGDVPAHAARPVVIRPSIERAQLDLTELVMDNLRAKLIATQRIAEYAATNTVWLEKQTAAELGELFESIDRAALAILDRMAGAGRAANPDSDRSDAADAGDGGDRAVPV